MCGRFRGTVDFDPGEQEDIGFFASGPAHSLAFFFTKYLAPDPVYYADCNASGIFDGCIIESGHSADQNQNGVPDECE